MEPDFTKAALLSYLDMIASKGLVNSHTAGGMKVAAAKLLEDAADADDVRELDVEGAAIKYHNKHPGDLSPGSLAIYARRLKRAISEFVEYKTNPLAFKPRSRITSAKASEKGKPRAARSAESVEPEVLPSAAGVAIDVVPSSPTSGMPSATTQTMALPYPLRDNFIAQVVIPRNINTEEARRLCAFIMTLAADFKPGDGYALGRLPS